MRSWAFLLAGLLIWAAHFFILYGIGSVFPGEPIASWLTIAVTALALAANGGLLWLVALRRLGRPDRFDRWRDGLTALGLGLSFVAVAWQGLPALFF